MHRLEPEDIARNVIDGNRYMVLGTADPDGLPRVSPVYYAPDGYGVLYWISAPDARHSRNVALRPAVSIVIFDSTAHIGAGRAVYLTARAGMVAEQDLDGCVDVACRPRFPEQRPFPPGELRAAASLRRYRATVLAHAIHVPGSDPVYGRGIDHRMPVTLR